MSQYRCTTCQLVVDIPSAAAWPVSCRCGAMSWVSPPEPSGTMVASGGYVSTEVDALRAHLAALQSDFKRLEGETIQLRALRDRLVAWAPQEYAQTGQTNQQWVECDDLGSIIATAEKLK